MAPAKKCSRAHRYLSHTLLFFLIGTIVVSGFAWPLGHYELAIWPWKQFWFMFSWDTKYHASVLVSGRRADGTEIPIDPRKWFHKSTAWESFRYHEVARKYEPSVRSLAEHICRKHNAESAAADRVISVTMKDVYWLRRPGVRLRADEAPESEKTYDVFAKDQPCAKS